MSGEYAQDGSYLGVAPADDLLLHVDIDQPSMNAVVAAPEPIAAQGWILQELCIRPR